MILVVEGFDNTGKTVTCKRIQNMLGWKLEHSPGPDVDIEKEFKLLIERARRRNIITDRVALISEQIYGPVLRGYSIFERNLKYWIDEFTQVCGGIIYCRPPINVIFGSLSEREQMDGVVKHRMRLLERYDGVVTLSQYGIPFYRYDYTEEGSARKLEDIIKEVTKNECKGYR